MSDQDLNYLLSEYRNKKPTDLQIQKWKNAIDREHSLKDHSTRSVWFQLVASSIVSFILGGIAFNFLQDKEVSSGIANNFGNDATIEYVYHK